MLTPGAGVAGLTAVATKEAVRRRGVGTAMTLAALRDGRALGYRAGVLWATEMGAHLYRRLGFRPYCTVSRYLWRSEG
jgi:predicted acetyltransferase